MMGTYPITIIVYISSCIIRTDCGLHNMIRVERETQRDTKKNLKNGVTGSWVSFGNEDGREGMEREMVLPL